MNASARKLALAHARAVVAVASAAPMDATPQDRAMRRAELDTQGFLVLDPLLAAGECDGLVAAIEALRYRRAGSRRLLDVPAFAEFARRLRRLAPVSALLPDDATAVQCTLFAKTPTSNWSVGAHHDLSVPVKRRGDAAGWTGWSRKETGLFAQAPVSVLERLAAVRVQLDGYAEDTGPLEVVPGSHRLGRLDRDAIDRLASGRRTRCVPQRGGAVVLRPLLVHASGKAASPRPRRVLHVLFGPARLPSGVSWADAV